MVTETVTATATVAAGIGDASGLTSQLVASFAGAAIAFVFFLVGQALVKAYERRKSHYNALVTLERVLNLQLDQSSLIRTQIPEMKEPVSRGQVWVALPRPILETDGLFLELLDLDLTNLLIDHRVSVTRMNADISNIGDAYRALKDRYLDGSLGEQAYIENSIFLLGKYEEVAHALETLNSQIMDILVRIRLRLRDRRPLSFQVVSRLSSVRSDPLDEATIAAEREKLASECAAAANPFRPE